MKNGLVLGGTTLASLFLFVGTVHAEAINFTAPASNSLVGKNFTLSGTYGAGCAEQNLAVIARDSRGNEGLVDSGGYSYRDNTSFRYTVDFSKSLEDSGQLIQPGLVTLTMGGWPNCSTSSLVVNYAVNPQQPATQSTPQSKTTITPTLSPTPSPTVTPSTSPPAVTKSSFFDKLDPQWWLLIGVMLGALLLGLAELSVKWYHRRHPKAKTLEKPE